MVRNVVEMMMKRTVSYSLYVFVVQKQMSQILIFLFCRHCCGSHFFLDLREPIAHANMSRRGPRKPLRYAGITMIRLENEYTDDHDERWVRKVTTKAVIAMTAWHACQILRVMTMIMMTDPSDNEGSEQ
jgi:hypothetical protein